MLPPLLWMTVSILLPSTSDRSRSQGLHSVTFHHIGPHQSLRGLASSTENEIGNLPRWGPFQDPIVHFPFHIASGRAAYCFQVRPSTREWYELQHLGKINKYKHSVFKFKRQRSNAETSDHRKYEYPYIIVRIVSRRALEISANSRPSWRGAVRVGTFPMDADKFGFNLHKQVDLREHDDERYIKILGTRYRVVAAWFLPTRSPPTEQRDGLKMQLNMAMQRMNVMANYHHFFESRSPPPFQIIEDAASVAAIAMITYMDGLGKWEGSPFYGGRIVQVLDVSVRLETHLERYPEIDGGSLQFMAWEAGGVFVVAARGTDSRRNWQIDFQLAPIEIAFEPYFSNRTYHGKVVRGMYEVIHSNLDTILTIFDGYDPLRHKRVILTGHSLGSGIAQVLSIMLLNQRNQHLIHQHPKVEHLIVDRSGMSSLEVITFGGPAIMNEALVTAGWLAMHQFNAEVPMTRRPLQKYMVTLYYKVNDPVTFTGKEALEYLKNHVMDDDRLTGKWSLANVYFMDKTTSLSKRMIAKGLSFVPTTRHFGTKVKVRSSRYATSVMKLKLAELIGVTEACHGEYFDLIPVSDDLKIWLVD